MFSLGHRNRPSLHYYRFDPYQIRASNSRRVDLSRLPDLDGGFIAGELRNRRPGAAPQSIHEFGSSVLPIEDRQPNLDWPLSRT